MSDRGAIVPWRGLQGYRWADLGRDALAGLAVAVLSIPQGVAYATMAGLPPVAGLYAASIPAVVGSALRSSRFVIAEPTNAMALLMAGAVAAHPEIDPLTLAGAIALAAGLGQLLAAVVRLAGAVDYISVPVVRGYITGAAFAIAVGQLPELIGHSVTGGSLVERIWSGVEQFDQVRWPTLVLAVGTATFVLLTRRIHRRFPGPVVALAAGVLASYFVDLQAFGLPSLGEKHAIPLGWPPLELPIIGNWRAVIGPAIAAAVLSLVESASVARASASEAGDKLDLGRDFAAQGAANVAAGIFGGYAVSGSLVRTEVNRAAGARTRLAGIFSGLFVLAALLTFAPMLGRAPAALLVGVLVVIALDLVDGTQLNQIWRSTWVDRAAFLATLAATFVLPLHEAIFVGVAISILLFLRTARTLQSHAMAFDDEGLLREVVEGDPNRTRHCTAIRILHVEGRLFFGSAGELGDAIDETCDEPGVRVVIVRIKRTQGLDITAARAIRDAWRRQRADGHHLLLVGVRTGALDVLERTEVAHEMGPNAIFPSQPGWFEAMDRALRQAVALAGPHACGDDCPVAGHVVAREAERRRTDLG